MHEIRERMAAASADCADGALVLPLESRRRSRMRVRLESGEEIAVILPRGTALRDGDMLRVDDGRRLRVVAQAERVMQVSCAGPQQLARAAYHLGNRHVPLQIAADRLWLAEDPVLRRMLEGLGATVTLVEAPFEPEIGAYGDTHGHGGVQADLTGEGDEHAH